MFFPAFYSHIQFLIHCRRIKNTQETPHDHLIHLTLQFSQASQGSQSLSGWNNSIMVCDLLVIDIPGFFQSFICLVFRYVWEKFPGLLISLQTTKIFSNLFGNGTGQHPGICSWISHQFFFIQLLHNGKGLIGTDLKQFRRQVLDFSQIKQKRRIFLFLLLLHFFNHRSHRLRL